MFVYVYCLFQRCTCTWFYMSEAWLTFDATVTSAEISKGANPVVEGDNDHASLISQGLTIVNPQRSTP